MRNSSNIALVTGGSGVLGGAICTLLAEKGVTVILQYHKNKNFAEEFLSKFPKSFIAQADLSKKESIDELCRICSDIGPVNILINNAGITINNLFLISSESELNTQLDTNLRSAWYLSKKISKVMIRNGGGHIINISSTLASASQVGHSIYGMTKAALESLTRSMAAELASKNILVNSIAPGLIKSEMTAKIPAQILEQLLLRVPLNRMAEPLEIATLVEYLALHNTYATGSLFHINGGLYAG